MAHADGSQHVSLRTLAWAGCAIGLGLGGFFDGILLHQVLQWHHLLSGLEEVKHDIRVLILTDGLFHILMYVIACVGLWLLWLSRSGLGTGTTDRCVLSHALMGFGLWHLIDAVLSHWLLGIHRIRMDVDNPLLWDLIWFLVFGLFPFVAGLKVRKADQNTNRLFVSPITLVVSLVTLGPISTLPPPEANLVMVMFRPGVAAQEAVEVIGSSGAAIVWNDPSEMVWVIDPPDKGSLSGFYGKGAIWVGNSILPAACFNWLEPGRTRI